MWKKGLIACVLGVMVLMCGIECGETIDIDYQYCSTVYSDRKEFLKTSYNPGRNLTYSLAKDSVMIKYMLNFNLVNYLKDNIVTLIPWMLLFTIAVLGWLCCFTVGSIGVFRKENPILTPKEKKKIAKDNKNEGEKKDELSDDDEEEKESQASDESVEEDIEHNAFISLPQNNYEFKHREIKINITIMVGLLCALIGLIAYCHFLFIDFRKDYLEYACRFNEMNKVLIDGNQSYHSFQFAGLKNMYNNASNIKTQYDTVNLSTSDVSSFTTKSTSFFSRYNELVTNLDLVHNSPTSNPFQLYPSPASSTATVLLDYLTNWGKYPEDVDTTGDWSVTLKMFRESYILFADSVLRFKSSGNPILMKSLHGVSLDDMKKLSTYKHLESYMSKVQSDIKLTEELYKDISDSFTNRLISFEESSPLIIFIGIYGVIVLSLGCGVMLEILYMKKRSRVCIRRLINSLWCVCAPFAVGVTVLLNILVPVIGSMSELNIIMEPILFNRTFYAKIEFPSDTVKGGLYGCLHGDNLYDNVNGIKVRTQDINDSISGIINSTAYDYSLIDSRLNELKLKMLEFNYISKNMYDPTDNMLKPTNVLKIINALSNCNTPTTIDSNTISQTVRYCLCRLYAVHADHKTCGS